jgi:DNA-directed RNA polymerase specialized sigma24 family protein
VSRLDRAKAERLKVNVNIIAATKTIRVEDVQASALGANLQFETTLASEILALAKPRVRRVLVGVHYEGHSLRQVAALMGVNHGVLSREVAAFANRMQAA